MNNKKIKFILIVLLSLFYFSFAIVFGNGEKGKETDYSSMDQEQRIEFISDQTGANKDDFTISEDGNNIEFKTPKEYDISKIPGEKSIMLKSSDDPKDVFILKDSIGNTYKLKVGEVKIINGEIILKKAKLEKGTVLSINKEGKKVDMPVYGEVNSYDSSTGILEIQGGKSVTLSQGGNKFLVISSQSGSEGFTFNLENKQLNSNGNFVVLSDGRRKTIQIKDDKAIVNSIEHIILSGTKDNPSEYTNKQKTKILSEGDICFGQECKLDLDMSIVRSSKELLNIRAKNNNKIQVFAKAHFWNERVKKGSQYYLKPREDTGHNYIGVVPIADNSEVELYMEWQYVNPTASSVKRTVSLIKFSKAKPVLQGDKLTYNLQTDIISAFETSEGKTSPWYFDYSSDKLLMNEELGLIDLEDMQDFFNKQKSREYRVESAQIITSIYPEYSIKGMSPITYHMAMNAPDTILESITGGWGRSFKSLAHFLYGTGEQLTFELSDEEWEFLIGQTEPENYKYTNVINDEYPEGKTPYRLNVDGMKVGIEYFEDKTTWKMGDDGWERVRMIEGDYGHGKRDESEGEHKVGKYADIWNMVGYTTIARKKISDDEYEYKIEETFDFVGSKFSGMDFDFVKYEREVPLPLAILIEKIFPEMTRREGNQVKVQGEVLKYIGKPFELKFTDKNGRTYRRKIKQK